MFSDARKMGKTGQCILWTARERASVCDFDQCCYNVEDNDVRLIPQLMGAIPLQEISVIRASDIGKAIQPMVCEPPPGRRS